MNCSNRMKSNMVTSQNVTNKKNAENHPNAASRRDSLPGIGVFTFSGFGFTNPGFQGETADSSDINNNEQKDLEYDPFDHVDVKHPSTFWGTIFHLVFLSAGTPVLLLPNKFVAAGYLYGTATMVLVFLFYVCSMNMVLWSAYQVCKIKRVPSLTYSNLVFETFTLAPPRLQLLAPILRWMICYIFIIGWYGSAILIYVLMVQNLQTICSSWLHTDFTEQQMVLIVFPPVMLLNLIRTLRFMEPCSTIGFFCNFVSILLVLYYTLTDTSAWKIQNQEGSPSGVPLFVGTIFFNINVSGLMISLQNEMKRPRMFGAPIGVMTISYTIILILFFSFSMFFGLKYGASMPINAIDIVPSNSVSYLITNIFYILGHFLLLPLMMYVPLEIISNDLLKIKSHGHKLVWEYALRIIMVALAAVLAYLNPNITFFISLAGLVGSNIDSIMLPAAMESIVEWRVGKRGKKCAFLLVKNLVLFILGFCFALSGVYNCIISL